MTFTPNVIRPATLTLSSTIFSSSSSSFLFFILVYVLLVFFLFSWAPHTFEDARARRRGRSGGREKGRFGKVHFHGDALHGTIGERATFHQAHRWWTEIHRMCARVQCMYEISNPTIFYFYFLFFFVAKIKTPTYAFIRSPAGLPRNGVLVKASDWYIRTVRRPILLRSVI